MRLLLLNIQAVSTEELTKSFGWTNNEVSSSTVMNMTHHIISNHYDNMPMQCTAIFHSCKNDIFQMKKMDIFSSPEPLSLMAHKVSL